ncbi:MAG: putative addiction module antidote protein [Mesorhizobium sp.]|nr:addiction module antidote protein [Mesorhizobium sp.]MCO5162574.1 putative addiction module antidote protein [Mesorhizobium sp.]
MTVKTTRWDVTESLDTDERIAGFIKVALEDGGDDPWMAASLLDDMARAIGMNEIARRTGIARELLYQALDSQNDHKKPTVSDILARVSDKLGARVKHEAAE